MYARIDVIPYGKITGPLAPGFKTLKVFIVEKSYTVLLGNKLHLTNITLELGMLEKVFNENPKDWSYAI